MNDVARAGALVALPLAASAVGAAVSTVRRPGPRAVSAIQHFAAGVVLAALVGEVLPDLRQEGRLPWATGGFAVGVVVMLALAANGRRTDARRARDGSGRALPVGLLAAVAVDLLLDGLLVGLGVRLGATQAIVLTVALTLEIGFLSLSLALELTEAGCGPARATAICTGLGMATVVGAVGGAAVLGGVGATGLAFVLALGAAALLFLAVEELLAEAHEQEETTVLSAAFFVGFLAVYVLSELGG